MYQMPLMGGGVVGGAVVGGGGKRRRTKKRRCPKGYSRKGRAAPVICMPAKRVCRSRKPRPANSKWLSHVRKFAKEHCVSWKDALVGAKASYEGKVGTKKNPRYGPQSKKCRAAAPAVAVPITAAPPLAYPSFL